jgi:uncharacterized phage protein (TIGR02220 family)
MARIRYLKPDFFKDEDLATFPYEVRLFFAGLWNFADKAGRLEDRPLRLKAEIFPYDKVDVDKCLELLSKLKNGSNKPFIHRYEIGGNKYIQIVNWDKHQKPHNTEKESEIPPIPPLNTKGMEKGTIKGMEKSESNSTNQNLLSNAQTTVKNLCSSIINDLNEVLNSNYRETTKITKDLIQTRINEGFTLDDFKKVHRNMFRRWGPDNKMREFLRPITLYSSKFESYLNVKQDLPISTAGAKTLMAGKEWIGKKEVTDVGQK